MKRFLALFVGVFLFVQLHAQQKISLPFVFKNASGSYTLIQYNNNVVKIIYQPDGYNQNEHFSDAVIAKPQQAVATKYEKTDGTLIQTGNFNIKFQQNGIQVNDSLISLIEPFEKNGYKGFKFSIHNNEKIYGGGSRALPLNRRGHQFNLYNAPWYGYEAGANNLNYSVPFITSSNGYALFFDNVAKGYLDIAAAHTNKIEYATASGELNFYIIKGATQQQILQQYHALTGKQPLPPKWALGNLMSRFGYTSEKQVKQIYAEMKSSGIPVDAIIFDLFWFGDSIKQTMGNLDWVNTTKWPDPKKMIADFKKDDVQTILITEPFVLKTSYTYNESKHLHATDSSGKPFLMTNFYFGNGGLIDLFRKDAQQWFWKAYKKQMQMGVEGWWGDLGEPETHPEAMLHNLKDYGIQRKLGANEVHNLYGHVWTKFLYDRYAKEYPDKRLFSLNRSGFAGTQRYSIFPWSGDVSRSWGGLQAQLPVMLGMSMSGIPYMHADAGGFAGGSGDNELYTRWLQFAVFTPVFRPHGTALYEVDPQAFSYPSEAALFPEPYKTISRKAINLRYQLLPYNYTLSYQQAVHAQPLVAPLYYYFEKDSNAASIEDQYMWGNAIMVAPVLQKNSTERKLYLPAAHEWYALNTAQKYTGGSTINVQLQPDAIPVFVKAGSFIPMADADSFKNIHQASSAKLAVHYYPSHQSSAYVLYDDDGVTKNAIAKKQFELIRFAATARKQSHQITITSNNGQFKGKPASRRIKLIVHTAKKYASVQINHQQSRNVIHLNDQLIIPFRFTGSKVVIQLME